RRCRRAASALRAPCWRVSRIRALDPTQRGIPDAERRRRGAVLLGHALVVADRCPVSADSSARLALDSARTELAQPLGQMAPAAEAERLTDRAEQIWRLTEGCTAEASTPDQRAAAVVLNKLRE